MWRLAHHLTEISHHHVRTVLVECIRVGVHSRCVVVVDADDEREMARATGLHARERVFNDDGVLRGDPEHLRAFEKTVGRGLSGEV